MKDNRTARERQEMADTLRQLRKEIKDRRYRYAFCRAVLANFRTGFMVIPNPAYYQK